MDTTPVKLPIHDHPLFPTPKFILSECSGCRVKEVIYGGYFCNEPYCNVDWFHKDCAEAPLEINHPSHPQHPLLLTNDLKDGPCDLCGQKLSPSYTCATCKTLGLLCSIQKFSPSYSCSTCEFNVDLLCGIKPSPPAIEHQLCHDHRLVFLKKQDGEYSCEVCRDFIDGPTFSCLECDVYFHMDCVHLSKEVNHPCHTNHPLKLITPKSLTDDAEKSCHLCGEQPNKLIYHCSICNFTTCFHCTKSKRTDTKAHEHPLTLFSRKISYNCDVCGMEGYMRTYICSQCDIVVHGRCIGSPQVISINRHDHRIIFTHHLGTGYSKCGVCRQILSQYYGAYSCTVCPNYAVHSRCAVRKDVWDGVELEGIHDDTEDIAPFKVVGDNLICHFSHEEHTLKLSNNYVAGEFLRCQACIGPLGFDPIYICQECCFVLHEKCANLPMKKKLVFGTRPYTLVHLHDGELNCELCGVLSGGFKYKSQEEWDVDVQCGSLADPFVHNGHIYTSPIF